MKRIKQILPIIIAFIVGISTTVGAVTVFNSKDITYSSSATSKKNVKEALDELYTKANTPWTCASGWYCYKTPKIISSVNIGDYISMTPTSTSYTISKDLTGYTSDQTINPSELDLWRVIRKNADGTVEMVSDKVSSKNIAFSGKEGYIKFIGALNMIAAQYTNNKYVESTRHMGYSNQTETLTNTSKLMQTTAPWTKDTSIYNQWTGCDQGLYLCGTDENLGAGDIDYETDYNLVNEVYGTMICKNLNGIGVNYWLASRRFRYASSNSWSFFLRFVSFENTLSHYPLYRYDNGEFLSDNRSYAVRPIVTIKSNVFLMSGDGKSKETAYNLE